MVGYTPDRTLNLNTENGSLTVHLAEGGEQFPWASHKGRVIIGPPDGTTTSDGVSMDSLDWQVNRFWVIEALDKKGDSVQLDPYQYARVVQAAEGCKMKHPKGSEHGTCECGTPNNCILR